MFLREELQRNEARFVSQLSEAERIIGHKDAELIEQARAMKGIKTHLRRAKDAIDAQRQIADHAQRQLLDAEKLLARRTTELDAAQNFLPVVDAVTDTHVVGLVQDLNYEIVQVASALAETYGDFPRAGPVSCPFNSAPSMIRRTRVIEVADILSRLHPDDTTTNLQIILQAFIVNLAASVISSWRFGEPTGLSEIFLGLRAEGKKTDKSDVQRKLTNALAYDIAYAMVFARYEDGPDFGTLKSAVLSQVKRQLNEVVRLVLELNLTIGQRVCDGWMEVDCVAFGKVFDPEEMEVTYGTPITRDVAEETKQVLCTTSLETNFERKRDVWQFFSEIRLPSAVHPKMLAFDTVSDSLVGPKARKTLCEVVIRVCDATLVSTQSI
ncbi:hypothetical protein K488DRAFT_87112 [Vararia minispora EC-137]|uniref:Uncharacterized protein n=1 Tax=Vararia minispora EC-137 TaxID=1314806 RepID=A0ACB8QGY3_9AGAM|nr:hypothetical protein K488DRAFT_87112 [Vararia minispora EC-137]